MARIFSLIIAQEELIKQLQNSHYEQYIAQVYAQQAQAQAVSMEGALPTLKTSKDTDSSEDSESGPKPADSYMQQVPSVHGQMGLFCHSNPKIAPASLWTSKNIVDFKNTIRKEGPDGILKVGHGETVTVRVPTHEEGTCLFWEFATDYYDIGFGVYFEWTIAESNQVTVHISESSDEELEDEAEGSGATAAGGDVETGGGTNGAKQKPRDPNKPLVDEVIPVYRRDCHEEVFAGSHVYPGRGVYLLKFDNSYSLWRSKTLYYRVFYSK
ncbi:golgi-dynamics membrane-trafficking domain-containing protein [Ditylenchus destructor]|nr:golgi-dynamics membrane-trafficking domain-containing protein [Ditylenchus destructor]